MRPNELIHTSLEQQQQQNRTKPNRKEHDMHCTFLASLYAVYLIMYAFFSFSLLSMFFLLFSPVIFFPSFLFIAHTHTINLIYDAFFELLYAEKNDNRHWNQRK